MKYYRCLYNKSRANRVIYIYIYKNQSEIRLLDETLLIKELIITLLSSQT